MYTHTYIHIQKPFGADDDAFVGGGCALVGGAGFCLGSLSALVVVVGGGGGGGDSGVVGDGDGEAEEER